MASYHLSVKTISRSAGRSATAASAYRTGSLVRDDRTGEVFDYRRRSGVEHSEIVTPAGAPEWARDRAALWNAAEAAENRKNSTVAREVVVALPAELDAEQRKALALELAQAITERHGCAVEVAIHEPSRDGDDRNCHTHLLMSTRRLGPAGFGEKTRELDTKTSGEVPYWRQRWAEMANAALEQAGQGARIDHRSHKARGLDLAPTVHLGPQASAMERRGEATERGDLNRTAQAVNQRIAGQLVQLGETQAEIRALKAAWQRIRRAMGIGPRTPTPQPQERPHGPLSRWIARIGRLADDHQRQLADVAGLREPDAAEAGAVMAAGLGVARDGLPDLPGRRLDVAAGQGRAAGAPPGVVRGDAGHGLGQPHPLDPGPLRRPGDGPGRAGAGPVGDQAPTWPAADPALERVEQVIDLGDDLGPDLGEDWAALPPRQEPPRAALGPDLGDDLGPDLGEDWAALPPRQSRQDGPGRPPAVVRPFGPAQPPERPQPRPQPPQAPARPASAAAQPAPKPSPAAIVDAFTVARRPGGGPEDKTEEVRLARLIAADLGALQEVRRRGQGVFVARALRIRQDALFRPLDGPQQPQRPPPTPYRGKGRGED